MVTSSNTIGGALLEVTPAGRHGCMSMTVAQLRCTVPTTGTVSIPPESGPSGASRVECSERSGRAWSRYCVGSSLEPGMGQTARSRRSIFHSSPKVIEGQDLGMAFAGLGIGLPKEACSKVE